MKIIHFSDTHLGFSELGYINENNINQREADFYDAFSQVIDAILEIKPDFVIHTGDFFHRPNPTNRAITFAFEEMKRIEKLNIPFILIAGNHSTPKMESSAPILRLFNSLENVYPVFNQKFEKIEFEDINFYCLPHINDEIKIAKELEKLENSIDETKKSVMMMHTSVGESYLMEEFGEWVYPKEKEYIFDKMDYVALGHWHKFSNVKKYKNVFYAGSTERTSRNDRYCNKGFVIIDIEDKLKVEFKEINIRKFYKFELDAKNLKNELEQLKNKDFNSALIDLHIKNLSFKDSFSQDELENFFEGAMHIYFKKEYENKNESIEIESISLKDYFIEYLKEELKDDEFNRLKEKSLELFLEIDNGIN